MVTGAPVPPVPAASQTEESGVAAAGQRHPQDVDRASQPRRVQRPQELQVHVHRRVEPRRIAQRAIEPPDRAESCTR